MSAKWKRTDELVWEELENETLVVSPRSGARWSLSALAAKVWKLCDGKRSIAQLASALSSARGEIEAVCETLASSGLLRPATKSEALAPLVAGFSGASGVRVLGLAGGGRRRPTPRGNSGPG